MRFVATLALAAAFVGVRAEVTIDNMDGGETVRYPVVILRGRTSEEGVRAGLDGKDLLRFPAFNHRYVAICELKPGKNMVAVKAGADSTKIRIDYSPMKSVYKVKAVWIEPSDASDAPRGIVPHGDYKAKLDVAMKLLQSFTAEAMESAGYGRKTFPLEIDANGKVIVHTVRLDKTGEQMRAMEGGASWSAIYQTLEKQFPGNQEKWVAINAFAGFDPVQGKLLGHYALGGGKLAAFGGGTVGHWPDSLAEVARTFANRDRIDPKKQFEDSRFRETVWANVSTAFGATLHELGHTFGLPHSPDSRSVMSRGFDFFNRSFMAYEPPYKGHDQEEPVLPDMVTRWDPFFAARLNWSPWFQPDAQAFVESDGPKIEFVGNEIVITGKHGLRVVGADRDDAEHIWQEHKGKVITEIRLNRQELRDKMGGRSYRIVAMDSQGNQTVVEDKP
jgi:hypothetical protein